MPISISTLQLSPFTLISLIIFAAACLGALVSLLRQPPLIGYIVAGLLLGALGLSGNELQLVELMGQFGVTLLLFLVGLELSFSDMKSVGRMILLAAFGQMLLTFLFGFSLASIFQFSPASSVFLGLALMFSSTIIVVKLLSEKKDLNSLHGKISVGMLLVQDVVAIIILMVLSGLHASQPLNVIPIIFILGKGIALLILALLLNRYIFPRLMGIMTLSSEMLFVTSIAWAIGFASFVSLPWIGFTVEIGGFLAGIALANSSEHYQIISRIRPVRDFFVIIFFIAMGAGLFIQHLFSILIPAMVFSLFVIISHFLLTMLLLAMTGARKRTAFLTGVALAQLSEFSLIIMSTGRYLGYLNTEAISVMTLTAIITMVISTYLITSAHRIYMLVSPYLSWIERKHLHAQVPQQQSVFQHHIVLIGFNRTGKVILPDLKKMGLPIVVVDFDPAAIDTLIDEQVIPMYGDISDTEFLTSLQLDKAKMLISTVSHLDDNLGLLEVINWQKTKPLTVFVASYVKDAIRLYDAHVDFVLVPHLVGGEYLSHFILTHGIDKKSFRETGQRHLAMFLQERKHVIHEFNRFFYHRKKAA